MKKRTLKKTSDFKISHFVNYVILFILFQNVVFAQTYNQKLCSVLNSINAGSVGLNSIDYIKCLFKKNQTY